MAVDEDAIAEEWVGSALWCYAHARQSPAHKREQLLEHEYGSPLRRCYAMSGADLAGFASAVPCPVLA
eukprot:3038484-Rhodomonas_salina.1